MFLFLCLSYYFCNSTSTAVRKKIDPLKAQQEQLEDSHNERTSQRHQMQKPSSERTRELLAAPHEFALRCDAGWPSPWKTPLRWAKGLGNRLAETAVDSLALR